MSKTLSIAFVGILLAGMAGGAYYYLNNNGGSDSIETASVSDAFCKELKDEAAYDKKKIAHYKMLIPGKDEWIFRTENDFRQNWHINKKTVTYLRNLQDAMKTQNADLVIVMPPIRGMVHNDKVRNADRQKFGVKDIDAAWQEYEAMISMLKSKGINIVGATQEEATDNFYYSRNHHWTSEGAEIVAQNVAAKAKTLSSYEQIPVQNFETTKLEDTMYESSYSQGFEKLCGTVVPDENAVQYETLPTNTAASESELFDAEDDPQVVLLGTSNSVPGASHANFEGFLKQNLSRDVINFSYIGAGIDTSLMSYLNSDHFRTDTPKLVIWEVPGYYDLNIMDDKIFNQAIPAAYGACDDNPIMQKTFSNLDGKSSIKLFTNDDAPMQKNAKGTDAKVTPINYSNAAADTNRFANVIKDTENMYLHLNFSEPVKKRFNVKFRYDDTGTKKQQFARAKRYPHDGMFYTLFPMVSDDKILEEVRLTLPKNVAGNLAVKASLCPIEK